jgi:hypothetical protein
MPPFDSATCSMVLGGAPLQFRQPPRWLLTYEEALLVNWKMEGSRPRYSVNIGATLLALGQHSVCGA